MQNPQPGKAPAPLPPLYYLENFQTLLSRVLTRYDDLLSTEESEFIQRFERLPTIAKALYVRLLSRKGDVFRAGKLAYEEIPALTSAIDALHEASLLAISPSLTVDEIFALFTKTEWLQQLDEPRLRNRPKADLLPILRARGVASEHMEAACKDPLLQLQGKHHFSTLKLLYFGNARQNLTDFVLRDLGIYRYESYRLDKQSRLFEQRQQIDAMLNTYAVRDQCEDLSLLAAGQLQQLSDNLGDAPPRQNRQQSA